MNAPDKIGPGIKPRNGNTAKAIEFIRKQGSARTDEIGEHLGIDRRAVQPLLYTYVKSGALITCLVTVTGKKHPLTEYRIGSGIPLGSGKGWKGEKFTISPTRPARLGDSLSDKDIASAKGQGKPTRAPGPISQTGGAPSKQAEVIGPQPEQPAAQQPAQPAVAQNTGSAAAPLSPCDGPRRTPATDASADVAGGIRLSIDNECQLCVLLSGEEGGLILEREQTRRLGEFLRGCEPLWSAA